MQVVVVDLSSDVGRSLRAMECALATAKATQKRARQLLALAQASPALLRKAEGIHARAVERVKKLKYVLQRATGELEVRQ